MIRLHKMYVHRQKHLLLFLILLFITGINIHSCPEAFTVGPSSPQRRLLTKNAVGGALRVSSKKDDDDYGAKSLLYYDETSSSSSSTTTTTTTKKKSLSVQERKRKKEEQSKQQKIAVYHNVLTKNANDCSVCTVPDKIDANKIAAPTTTKAQAGGGGSGNKGNGVTRIRTIPETLLQIKKEINQLIQEPFVELTDALLILASSFFVAMGTVPILPPTLMKIAYFGQDATLYFLAFGFVVRWITSLKPRGTYFVEDPLEWVDLIVVVLPFLFMTVPGLANSFPPWMTSQTSLINLRLLRVLRFQRILQDEITYSKFVDGIRWPIWSQKESLSCVIVENWQLQLARVLLSIFTLLSVSTGLIYSAEHVVNPGITDYFSALYFGLTTLTTVGFGDVTPVTWEGKLVVSGSILAGVAVIPAQAAALVEALLARDADNTNTNNLQSSSSSSFNSVSKISPPPPPPPPPPASTTGGKNLVLETAATCPNCGAGLHWSQANFCYNCGEKMSSGT